MPVVNRVKKKQLEAVKQLKRYLRPGKKVYTSNVRVFKSGMGAWIKVLIVWKGEILDISGDVSEALGLRWDGGVRYQGAGLDRGYFLVLGLSRTIFNADHGLKQEWL